MIAAMLCGAIIFNILGDILCSMGSWNPPNIETNIKIENRKKVDYVNIYPSHKLRQWEDFINDGREIASIAQLIECYDKYNGFPEDALDYLQSTVGIDLIEFYENEAYSSAREKYLETFVKELFKWHAKITGMTVSEAVEKWRIKLHNCFPYGGNGVIDKISVEYQWEWDTKW